MTGEHAVLLRLLSGLNAGAEMELGPGEWILGSGEESHLLVMDAGVRARHLALEVAGDGSVRLTPLEGEVRLDGTPVPGEGLPLPAFTAFSAGGCSACIGPARETWPSPLPVPAAPASPDADAGETRPPAGDAAPAPTEPDGDPAPAPAASAHNVGGDKVGGTRFRRLAVRLGLGALLLGLVVHGGWCSRDRKEAGELTLLLQEAGYTDTEATETPEGGLLVQGLVPGNAALDELGLYVESVAPGAKIDVLSVEAVAQALQARVRRADAALRVSRAGTGLRVVGYVYDLPTLEALFAEEQDLLRHVPVTTDLTTWKDLAPLLTRLVRSRNLKSRLRVIPGAYRISVQTQPLSPQEEENLNAVLREAEMEVSDTQPFVREMWEQPTRVTLPPAVKQDGHRPTAAAPAAAPAAGLPDAGTTPEPETETSDTSLLFTTPSAGGLRCEEVTVAGSGPYMEVVYEGSRYGVGAKLPNGYQVRAVTPRYVVFRIGTRYTRICTPPQIVP